MRPRQNEKTASDKNDQSVNVTNEKKQQKVKNVKTNKNCIVKTDKFKKTKPKAKNEKTKQQENRYYVSSEVFSDDNSVKSERHEDNTSNVISNETNQMRTDTTDIWHGESQQLHISVGVCQTSYAYDLGEGDDPSPKVDEAKMEERSMKTTKNDKTMNTTKSEKTMEASKVAKTAKKVRPN